MLVQEIMTKQVIAIDPTMPIGDVLVLMEQRNIRHFPILAASSADEDSPLHLVGIVSDRDIRVVGSEHPKAPKDITLKDSVEHIMVSPVLTAHPLDPVEEAAKVLHRHKIGAMPVVQDDELVGIVTGIDFLAALVKMTGLNGSSEGATSRFEVELDNRPGALAALLKTIAQHNLNVVSVMTTRIDKESVCCLIRVATIDGHGLATTLRSEGFSVLWPQDVVDVL